MLFTKCFWTVFLERKSGITGVPFGRTDISIGGIGTTFTLFYTDTAPRALVFKGCPKKIILMFFCSETSNWKKKVGFDRKDLSIGANGTTDYARLHRHGPVGHSFQGMLKKSFFMFFFFSDLFCLTVLTSFCIRLFVSAGARSVTIALTSKEDYTTG